MNIATKHILTTIKWLILVSAYTFLVYKLVTFDGYASLAEHFRNASYGQYALLLCVFLLLPLNITFEALKWRRLVGGIQPISFSLAIKSVLVGQVGAFFTPNRLGDFPTRALLLDSKNAVSAMALGYVGSFALVLVITLAGCVAFPFYLCIGGLDILGSQSYVIAWLIGALLVVFVAFVLFIIYYKRIAQLLQNSKYEWLHRLGEGFNYLQWKDWTKVVGLSAMRYVVFSTQLYAMLLFMGVSISPFEALMAIPTIYLLVTYTPSFAFSEAVVRGSYAIMVLSAFSTNEVGMALASILLWAINYCLPMLVGSSLFRRSSVR